MPQSMSRVAHCIDNGPMEGFWGILKQTRMGLWQLFMSGEWLLAGKTLYFFTVLLTGYGSRFRALFIVNAALRSEITLA